MRFHRVYLCFYKDTENNNKTGWERENSLLQHGDGGGWWGAGRTSLLFSLILREAHSLLFTLLFKEKK